MKRILSIITVFTLLLTACTGDQGPPGFDGPQGPAGEPIVADAIEVNNVNFTSANNFQIVTDFDQIFSEEVILIYRRWNDPNENVAVWRLLPQTVIFEDGNDLVYNYDFTQNDAIIFLDSSLDLNNLGPEWTFNQSFRIVIVPAESIGGVDVSNIETVMQTLNITEFSKR